jgi:spore maturation protein SpmB
MGEGEAEEVLVELPRLLRITAAVGVVMQTLDHRNLRSFVCPSLTPS